MLGSCKISGNIVGLHSARKLYKLLFFVAIKVELIRE